MRLLTGGQEEALINLMSWNKNSRKFAVAIYSAYPHPYTNRDGESRILALCHTPNATFISRI